MKINSEFTQYVFRKSKSGFKARWIPVVLCLSMSLGVAANSQAGILDDIGDTIGGVIDKVANLFSSAKNVVESVVDKIDKNVIDTVTDRCSIVEAENADGESDTESVVGNCSVRKLRDVFQDVGGEIIEQGRSVDDRLGEIAKDEWEDVSGSYADAVKQILAFLGDAAFDPLLDVSKDLLNAMKDVKSTLADFDFPFDEVSNSSDLDLSYTIPLGAASLELLIRGTVNKDVTEQGLKFLGVDGKLIARLKSVSASFGYAPQVMAQMDYVNPIFKIENNRITGILVMQPAGEIKMHAVVLPLQFSAGLTDLMKVTGLKNISVLRKPAEAISVDADVGTVALTLPLTNHSGDRLKVGLSVSAGVDAVAKITGNWRVKIIERVSWSRDFTIDVPAIQLPLGSIPRGVIGALEPENTAPSYAEQIVAYSFDQAGSRFIEDKSGFGNHANAVGGVTVKDGAAYFNGRDGYIDLPDDLMGNLDAITVYTEVYINPEQETPYFIYGLGNTNGDWGDGYLFTTGDTYRSAMSTCHWICEQSTFENTYKVPRESWHKLVYTVKDNVATLYMDGDLVIQNKEMTLKPSDIGGGKTVANYIGRSLYSGDKYLNGAMRNFQIWNGALTHKEIVDKFGDGPIKSTIVVRAQGSSGSENLNLTIGGQTIETWKLSTKMSSYSVDTYATGEIRVAFTNDATDRDVRVDYIKVNSEIRQAEDQDDNTGVWGNGSCGGGTKSEWLHCDGSIGFGQLISSQ